MGTEYTAEFYSGIGLIASRAARQILPFVLDLVAPQTIVDVGCGTGEWLAVAMEYGVTDVLGLDGPYVEAHLTLPHSHFQCTDLELPLEIDRRFDLAISIEVAEHLRPEVARQFIEGLTRLAPVVLFGAAIPGQGGVHHVNEQWLDYWCDLFEAHGYQMVDAIRRRFWDDPRVVYHSAQNLALFVDLGTLADHRKLADAHDPLPLRVVHPALLELSRARPPSVGTLVRQFPEAMARTLRAKRRQLRSRIGR